MLLLLGLGTLMWALSSTKWTREDWNRGDSIEKATGSISVFVFWVMTIGLFIGFLCAELPLYGISIIAFITMILSILLSL